MTLESLTRETFRERRALGLPLWRIKYLPFSGTPLDDGRYGTIEIFYASEETAQAAFRTIATSGHAEGAELTAWRRSSDGGWYGSTLAEYQAPDPAPAATHGAVAWWGSKHANAYTGILAAVTVAEVRHADEGEAEGGLGSMARFLAAASGVGLGPPSPAGWYWTAAVRGVWTRPRLAASAEAAMAEASAYVTRGPS